MVGEMTKRKTYPTVFEIYAENREWKVALPFHIKSKHFWFNLLHLDLHLFNQSIFLGIGWGTDWEKLFDERDAKREKGGITNGEYLFWHKDLRLGQAIYNALGYRLKKIGEPVTNESVGMLLHGAKAEDLKDLLEKSGKEIGGS